MAETGKPIKKRTVTDHDTEPTQEKQLTAGSRNVGTSVQSYAQIFNYSELKNILMQNVGKSSTKTFVQYSILTVTTTISVQQSVLRRSPERRPTSAARIMTS